MMKSTAIVIFGLVALASVAVAGTAIKKTTHADKKINCGASYIVGAQRDATGAQKLSAREQEVTGVAKTKVGDVQACWSRLPTQLRKVETQAVLKFAVDDTGEVQTVEVAGKVPDEARRCIAVAVARWDFPATDATPDPSYIEYPVTLRAP